MTSCSFEDCPGESIGKSFGDEMCEQHQSEMIEWMLALERENKLPFIELRSKIIDFMGTIERGINQALTRYFQVPEARSGDFGRLVMGPMPIGVKFNILDKIAKDHDAPNLKALVKELRKLTEFRNVMCHQSLQGYFDDHLTFEDWRTDPVDFADLYKRYPKAEVDAYEAFLPMANLATIALFKNKDGSTIVDGNIDLPHPHTEMRKIFFRGD